jgi:hypothetical protein
MVCAATPRGVVTHPGIDVSVAGDRVPAEGGCTMWRLFLWLVVIVFVVAIFGPLLRGFGVKAAQPATAAQPAKAVQPAKPADGDSIMQKKLAHAQKLLEGIALSDMTKIGQNANELMTLSKQAEFKIYKTPQYDLHSNDFRRTIEDIQNAVKQKNLDAATLGYMDMTMSCVRCHKYVREVRITLNDRTPTDIRTGTSTEAGDPLR